METKRFTYTKDNGEVSERNAIIMAKPRTNYLVLDISKTDPQAYDDLINTFEEVEDYKQERIQVWEKFWGLKFNDLWRSFKPEGIEWE